MLFILKNQKKILYHKEINTPLEHEIVHVLNKEEKKKQVMNKKSIQWKYRIILFCPLVEPRKECWEEFAVSMLCLRASLFRPLLNCWLLWGRSNARWIKSNEENNKQDVSAQWPSIASCCVFRFHFLFVLRGGSWIISVKRKLNYCCLSSLLLLLPLYSSLNYYGTVVYVTVYVQTQSMAKRTRQCVLYT